MVSGTWYPAHRECDRIVEKLHQGILNSTAASSASITQQGAMNSYRVPGFGCSLSLAFFCSSIAFQPTSTQSGEYYV